MKETALRDVQHDGRNRRAPALTRSIKSRNDYLPHPFTSSTHSSSVKIPSPKGRAESLGRMV